MPGSHLLKCRVCAGVLMECWWAEIKVSQRKFRLGVLQQLVRGKQGFFPLTVTTSSGQNAQQTQAETACWSQQGCLPRDFDAYAINGKGNPTGKELQKCLRASPCTGAGSYILNDRCLRKSFLKSLLRALVESFLPVSQCCDFAGSAAILA